jgi:DNA-binding MarR family transcriptional regulator
MNAVIANLEQQGLIRRVQSRDHARVRRTELTAKGRRVLAACDREIEAFEQQMLAALPAAQRDAFTAALPLLARRIEALEHDDQRSA